MKLLTFGGFLIVNVYNSYYIDNMFRILAYLIGGLAFFYYLFTTIFDEIQNYKLTHKLDCFGTCTGTMIIIIILSIIAFNEYKLHKTSLLKAYNYGQYFDLKKDGTCFMKSGDNRRYGTYQITDSTIIFDKIIEEDSLMVSNKFSIRKLKNVYESEQKNKFANYLVQVDINGNLIKMHPIYAGVYGQIAYVPFYFKIFEDHRNLN